MIENHNRIVWAYNKKENAELLTSIATSGSGEDYSLGRDSEGTAMSVWKHGQWDENKDMEAWYTTEAATHCEKLVSIK